MAPTRENQTMGTGDGYMKNGNKSRRVAYFMIASVKILSTGYYLGKNEDFVCFPIRPINSRDKSVPLLYIFDHRQMTIKAAKLPVPSSGDRYHLEGLQGVAAQRERMRRRPVIEVANSTPAKVVVIEQKDPGERVSHFINLYHVEGGSPTGLLSVHSYARRMRSARAEYNTSFWSKTLTHPRHRERSVLISLTSEERRIIVNGPKSREVTIIGNSIRTEREGVASSSHDDMVSIENPMPYE